MYMAHADQSKYGTFMAGLDTKYSLLKDKSQHEYPVDMVSAHNAIGNHRWDPGYKRHKDKKGDKSSRSNKDKEKKDDSDKPASLNLSFAQYAGKGICYCCGQKHAFQDCPKKDTTPKNEWFITKTKVGQQYSQVAREIVTTNTWDKIIPGHGFHSSLPASRLLIQNSQRTINTQHQFSSSNTKQEPQW